MPRDIAARDLPKLCAAGAVAALLFGTAPLASWLDKAADTQGMPGLHTAASKVAAIPVVDAPYRAIRHWIDSVQGFK